MYARCFWSKWNSKSTDTSAFALIALRGQWASFWQDYSANQATPPKYHRHYRWDTKSLVLGINFLLAGCTLRSVSLRGLDDVVRWNVLESGKTSQRRCFHWDSATEAKCYNWSTLYQEAVHWLQTRFFLGKFLEMNGSLFPQIGA